MITTLRRAALALALAAASAAPAMAQEGGKGGLVKGAQHGDWTMFCAPEGGPCVMEQTGRTADGKELLHLRLIKIKPQKTPQGTADTVLNGRVPLGVLLGGGLAVSVDGGKELRMPYEVCGKAGCVVQTLVLNDFIAAFKKGVKATFTVRVGKKAQPISTEISLKGFTKAYNSMKPSN